MNRWEHIGGKFARFMSIIDQIFICIGEVGENFNVIIVKFYPMELFSRLWHLFDFYGGVFHNLKIDCPIVYNNSEFD